MAIRISRRLATAMVVAAGAFGAVGAPAQAQVTEIKISHQWKQDTDGRDKAARVFVQEVNKHDPNIKFRIYPSSSLNIKPLAQADALQNGSLEMAVFPMTYAAGKIPEFSITLMPGTIPSLAAAKKLKGTPFHKKLQDVAEKNGLHMVSWWWTPGGFATKKTPITGPDSVKGLSMRAADPTFEVMLKAAGASVQGMPSTEIYPALQSGVLDGALTSAESFVSMRLYEQTKHATIGGNTLWMLLQPLVMSKQWWDKLTPAQQKIFNDAADVSDTFFDGLQEEVVGKMKETFEKADNKVKPLSDAEYKAWVDLAKQTSWKEFTAISADAAELLKLLQAASGS